MNINDYIKKLSLNDKKNLVQKTLKLGEEFGELSKKILPYVGSYGTNHRIVNKDKILEELADLHLVNQSILYDLGFTLEDFEDKLIEKAQVWNSLQIKEDRALSKSDLMPYEIHITLKSLEGVDINVFKEDCKTIGVKPIVLALQDLNSNKVMDDIMTSSKIYGNNGEAFNEMKRISNALTNLGYNVVREKIEASYWHTKAPFKEGGDTKMPAGCYFEVHLNIECTNEKLNKLNQISKSTNCHLSKNAFKIIDDNTFTIMMTYRSYEQMFEDFEEHLNFIKDTLQFNQFKLEKEIIEFAIYDTKINHDKLWLEA